ncbi:response regulator [Brevundimonas viscosa]|uniref:CheY chemotaxis protein or a CheY-like REC (Receiver) domain n=1 Tax=Brevundimonas viscosa TaxID=871741 RepID=A0A1I6TAV6_9CAUL|nr:response regulator [Brevundimonas viscosa]SFS86349.1 CheY chemotaxis protein or a CheY-like REC (receiver) domain [Brevundimonas viscosa]
MASASRSRVNLEHSSVLLIDDNQKSLDMLSSIFHGFGVKEQIKCESAIAATDILKRRMVDLVLVDCSMPEMDGYDFVRWLRRETTPPLRYVPIIMLTGHAAQSLVHKSRDCGASFVVAKPLTPAVLLKRILWLGMDERQFVEADDYVGPDRRVRNFGPPLGQPGRRAGDLSTHVGAASEPNLDQADIDMLLKPQRVVL